MITPTHEQPGMKAGPSEGWVNWGRPFLIAVLAGGFIAGATQRRITVNVNDAGGLVTTGGSVNVP